jgi:hypothetical protein
MKREKEERSLALSWLPRATANTSLVRCAAAALKGFVVQLLVETIQP